MMLLVYEKSAYNTPHVAYPEILAIIGLKHFLDYLFWSRVNNFHDDGSVIKWVGKVTEKYAYLKIK